MNVFPFIPGRPKTSSSLNSCHSCQTKTAHLYFSLHIASELTANTWPTALHPRVGIYRSFWKYDFPNVMGVPTPKLCRCAYTHTFFYTGISVDVPTSISCGCALIHTFSREWMHLPEHHGCVHIWPILSTQVF